MKFFPEMSVVFSIGAYSLKWYTVLIWLSIGLAYLLTKKKFNRAGYDNNFMLDFFTSATLSGVVGARLWYVTFSPDHDYYFSNPLNIFKTWEGGLAIQGVIVGVVIYTYWLSKKKKISALRIFDIMMPVTLVAQALGRWGNFFNQEAYGPVVPESFFNYLPNFIKEGMLIYGSYRFPTFLIEGVFNVIGYVIIYTVFKRWLIKKRGDYTYSYLLWTGTVRMFIELYRTDNLIFLGMKSAQVFSGVYIVIAILGFMGVINRWFKPVKPVILFDYDGTLADSRKLIGATFKELFASYNYHRELSEEELDAMFGPPLAENLARYFPELDTQVMIKEYRLINQRLQKTQLKAIAHAEELLKYLKAEGYQIGVISNKTNEALEFSMKILDLRQYIDVVVGSDVVDKTKPDKEPIIKACLFFQRGFDEVIMVGDSIDDIRCGVNAGTFTIAFSDYPGRKEALLAEKPNRYIEDLREIKEIIKEQHSWTYNQM